MRLEPHEVDTGAAGSGAETVCGVAGGEWATAGVGWGIASWAGAGGGRAGAVPGGRRRGRVPVLLDALVRGRGAAQHDLRDGALACERGPHLRLLDLRRA